MQRARLVMRRSAEVERARSAVLDACSHRRAARSTSRARAPAACCACRRKAKPSSLTGTPIVEVGDPRHVEVVAEFLSQDAVRMKHGARGADRELGRPAAAGSRRSRRARRAHEDLGARRRRATHERDPAVQRTGRATSCRHTTSASMCASWSARRRMLCAFRSARCSAAATAGRSTRWSTVAPS